LREWSRTLAISAGVGVGVTIVVSLASDRYSVAALLGGALIGACIGLGAALVDFYVITPLEPFAARARWLPLRPLRMVGFFLGGVAGWSVGARLAWWWLGFDPWPRMGPAPMLVFGGIAVVVGLLFEAYGRLRFRLEQSVAELKEREFAEKELATARAIQRRLLPPETAEGNGYRLAALNLPARVVAGDFYDFFPVSDGSLVVAVADVSGKGMGASLIMASTKAMLQLVAAERATADALVELNRRLHADLARREFVALLLLRFHPETGEVELANAGLPDPYLLGPEQPPKPVEASGPRLPLGVRPDVAYRGTRFVVPPGHRLLLFTDGLAEARDERDEPFGYDRLSASLAAPGLLRAVDDERTLRDWLDAVAGLVAPGEGRSLEDDCTVVVLERPRAAGRLSERRARATG
jgi:serine phosphatase RsbU (regulator of sigma subunit)